MNGYSIPVRARFSIFFFGGGMKLELFCVARLPPRGGFGFTELLRS